MRPGKRLEKIGKKLAVTVLGTTFKRGRPDFVPPDARDIQRVLFIRPEKIGDIVVTLPVFDALKAHVPEVAIDFMVSPRSNSIVCNDPRFDRVFVYHKQLLKDRAEIARMRSRRYDYVFDMIDDDSVTGLLLSQLVGRSTNRIGANKQRFAKFYDGTTSNAAMADAHSIDRALNVLDLIGIDPPDGVQYAPPFLSREQHVKVSKFFRDYDLSPSDVLIGYNVSAGKPTRLWAVEKAAELIHTIRKYLPDATVILISSPDDRERGVRLRSMCGGNTIHVPAGLNILDVAVLLSRLNCLISPDTSLVHIARSFKVPVVGLYPRPEWNLNRWRPYGQVGGVVRSGSEGDIFDITVDQVFAEFCAVYEAGRVISP